MQEARIINDDEIETRFRLKENSKALKGKNGWYL